MLRTRQPERLVETRSGLRHIRQTRQAIPVPPGWRAYAVTALGPGPGDGPLHLIVYDRIEHLPDGPLAA